jgi:hypothetical protein
MDLQLGNINTGITNANEARKKVFAKASDWLQGVKEDVDNTADVLRNINGDIINFNIDSTFTIDKDTAIQSVWRELDSFVDNIVGIGDIFLGALNFIPGISIGNIDDIVVLTEDLIEDTTQLSLDLRADFELTFKEFDYKDQFSTLIEGFVIDFDLLIDQFTLAVESIDNVTDEALEGIKDATEGFEQAATDNSFSFPTNYQDLFDELKKSVQIKLFSPTPVFGDFDALLKNLLRSISDDQPNVPKKTKEEDFMGGIIFFASSPEAVQALKVWAQLIGLLFGNNAKSDELLTQVLNNPLTGPLAGLFEGAIGNEVNVNAFAFEVPDSITALPEDLRAEIRNVIEEDEFIQGFIDKGSAFSELLGLSPNTEKDNRKEAVENKNVNLIDIITQAKDAPQTVGDKQGSEGDINKRFQDLVEGPEDNWLEMFSTENLFRVIGETTDYVKDVIKDLSSAAEGLGNTLQTLIDKVADADEGIDNIKDDSIEEAQKRVNNIRETMVTSVDLVFEMLLITPTQGGLEDIRLLMQAAFEDVTAPRPPQERAFFSNFVILTSPNEDLLRLQYDLLLRQFELFEED